MAKDDEKISAFMMASASRTRLGRTLRGAGFDATHVVELEGRQLWAIRAKPNSHAKTILGSPREILIVGTEHNDVQQRTLNTAEALISAERRLSDEVCIIVSNDPDAERKVADLSDAMNTLFIGLRFEDLKKFRPEGPEAFLAEIQSRFFFKDLYNISSAIVAKHAFYGRESLLSEIGHSLRHGTSNIALFGLRRMGKTSVLLRLLETLRAAGNVFVAHLDVQKLDAVRQDGGFLLWAIGQQLLDSNKRLRQIEGLKLFGKFSLYSEVNKSEDDVFELFLHDLSKLVASLEEGNVIVLLVDEIEHMLPTAPGSRWGTAFVRVWRLFRGLSHTNPGKVAIFVSGTSPSCVEDRKIDGVINPAHNFFRQIFLGPLALEDGRKLLTDIGTRIGLEWDADAVDEVVDLVGGHPLLLRAYGSCIHKLLTPRRQVTRVSLQDVRSALETVMLEVNSTLTQMIEVLEEEYQDEYSLLSQLADGQVSDFRLYAAMIPDGIRHLRGYGLIGDPATTSSLTNRLLHEWMSRRLRARRAMIARRANTSGATLQPGDDLEGYQIIRTVGRGGFADVYEALSRPGIEAERVALKVIRNGNLRELSREVDAIQGIADPGIVRIFDHGRTINNDVYLAMEFLSGPLLRDFCSPAKRFSVEETESLMRALLKTLVALHQSPATIARLQSKEEWSASDFQQAQHARFGIIHRDIKPENIILTEGRGPVLIDFGIASRVGDAVRTVSATRGYSPPEGFGASWEPDVDLYGLAVSIAQVLTGVSLLDSAVSKDLIDAVKDRARGHLRVVLLRELSESRAQRYSSAVAMQNALSGAV